MKISIKYILFFHIFFVSVILGQIRQAATVDIRIKIVKNISVEVSESNNELNPISENSIKSSISSVAKRDLMIQYGNRLKSSSKLSKRKRKIEISHIPPIGIVNEENEIIAQLTCEKQISLNNLNKTDKIKFLYSQLSTEQAYNYEPSITIIY